MGNVTERLKKCPGASMGPRRYRRGWVPAFRRPNLCPDWLQWGRDVIVADGRILPLNRTTSLELHWGRDVIVADGRSGYRCRKRRAASFNGAATLSSRMAHEAPTVTGAIGRLQWGRDVIVADGRPSRYQLHAKWNRFNGAATLSSRMEHHLTLAIPTRSSFNGAATLSSRMAIRQTANIGDGGELQWGRDVIVADGRASSYRPA